MARRDSYRYLGNGNKLEVHDLDYENTGSNGCQIEEITHRVTFDPDTLEQAHSEGYDNCAKCLPAPMR